MKMKKILFSLLFLALSAGAILVGTNAKAADIDKTPDCDNVSVIYCGVSSTADAKAKCKANKTGDLDNIYKAFGFDCNDINNMVNGVVWRNGNVTIGNNSEKNVVATNAMTAGRNYGGTPISGSKNAGKYSTSKFVNAGQTALLKFDSNGKFLFAIVKPCGNPVSAKPKQPAFSCKDLVASAITRTKFSFTAKSSVNAYASVVSYKLNFGDGSSRTVKTNATTKTVEHDYSRPGVYATSVDVTFKFATNGATKTVKDSDCATKVTVSPAPTYSCTDLIPQKISRTDYKFTAKAAVNHGASVVSYTFTYGDGSTQTVKTTSTSATVSHSYTKPGTFTASVAIAFKADGKTVVVKDPKCATKVTVAPAPTYACESLKANPLSRTEFRFDAKASATNATINKYVFSYSNGQSDTVVTSATTASATRNFPVANEYVASVTVFFTVNGEPKQSTNPNCTVLFNVVPPPPVYTCDLLTAHKISRTEASFTANASASNGATINGYRYDFGDGTSQTVKSTASTYTTQHTYAKPGDYNARVTALISIGTENKEVTSDKCTASVHVESLVPAATCVALKVNYLAVKTDVTLTGTASTDNGATISAYVFVIKDASGATIKTVTVPSTSLSATTEVVTLTPGTYSSSLTVKTSLGDKTSPACNSPITIPSPEKVLVCNPATGTIIEVDKGQEGNYAPVDSPKCQKVEVCNPATGEIITVTKDQEGNYKPVGDEACKDTVEVCNPATGETITVSKDQEGNYKPVGDEACVEETPEVLPSTGPAGVAMQLIGLSSLAGGATAYIRSRRA